MQTVNDDIPTLAHQLRLGETLVEQGQDTQAFILYEALLGHMLRKREGVEANIAALEGMFSDLDANRANLR